MKQLTHAVAGSIGLLLAGTGYAGIIQSTDGLTIEGGSWGSRELVVGWTVTNTGADVRGVTNTVSFASSGSATFEVGNFNSGGSRIGRDFLRNAMSSLDTNGSELDASFSWFTDGDTLDFSGDSSTSVDFTSGLSDGSNWFFITLDNAPTNYTGHTIALGGVSEIAIELIWDDADSSGTRSTDDTYDFGRIYYATGGDSFEGNGWIGGAPISTIPESNTYALLAGLTGFAFVALRHRS